MNLLVADNSYSIVAILSNVNEDVIHDYNRFCEVTAILEAAVEQLVNLVNGVVSAVSSIVTTLSENDVLTVKWVSNHLIHYIIKSLLMQCIDIKT